VIVDVSGSTDQVVLTASGEIDSSSAPVLRRHLDEMLEGAATEITVDLRGVSFLDSAGLCVLASAHRRATAAGVRLRVLASSRAVIRPLQITGLWALLQVEHVEP
jgi:anti-sigma B factor antagonist